MKHLRTLAIPLTISIACGVSNYRISRHQDNDAIYWNAEQGAAQQPESLLSFKDDKRNGKGIDSYWLSTSSFSTNDWVPIERAPEEIRQIAVTIEEDYQHQTKRREVGQ